MAETSVYGRSTYDELIDDVKFEINDEPDKMIAIPASEWKRWQLNACQDLTNRFVVRDERDLRLSKNVSDYLFANTKGVTGTGTITSVGTAVVGVGTKFLTQLIAGSILATPNGTAQVESVTGDLNLVLMLGFNIDVSGVAFTFSPKANEIPIDAKYVEHIDRSEGGLVREVRIRKLDFVNDMRQRDGITSAYSSLNDPYVVSHLEMGGRRYLRFYPAVIDADKTVRLYMVLSVKPRAHTLDSSSDFSPLDERFDPAVKSFMEWEYYKYYKNLEREKIALGYYNGQLAKLVDSLPNLTLVQYLYT